MQLDDDRRKWKAVVDFGERQISGGVDRHSHWPALQEQLSKAAYPEHWQHADRTSATTNMFFLYEYATEILPARYPGNPDMQEFVAFVNDLWWVATTLRESIDAEENRLLVSFRAAPGIFDSVMRLLENKPVEGVDQALASCEIAVLNDIKNDFQRMVMEPLCPEPSSFPGR